MRMGESESSCKPLLEAVYNFGVRRATPNPTLYVYHESINLGNHHAVPGDVYVVQIQH